MLTTAEASHLTAAREGDVKAFERLTEPYRRELTWHGYRMLGSLQDAEDVLQETLLRAWRRLATFGQDLSFRAWLYKIATNLCLDWLKRNSHSHDSPEPWPKVPTWIEPLPTPELDRQDDPESKYLKKEDISLAFLVALQSLPPRQRAILILSEVLDWRADEIAQLLEGSISSVNSALFRARATLKRQPPQATRETSGKVLDQRTRDVLDQYVSAWEVQDVGRLVELLRRDAVLSMPPMPIWQQGRESVLTFFRHSIFEFPPSQPRWRLVSTVANGQPAFGVYKRASDGPGYDAFALQVLTLDKSGTQITGITSFMNIGLFGRFGLRLRMERGMDE